jgi:Na+/H+ antiporter NhaD/arsenite permease-like protein
MIIGAYSGISYARYASVMAPTGLVLLVVTAAGLSFAFRRDLRGARPAAPPPPGPLDRGRAVRFATTFGAVLAGFFAGLPLAWVALGGACLSAMLRFGEPTETLRRVDWSLLLFFASLFVVIGGLSRAGWVEAAVGALRPALSDDPAGRPLPFAAFSLVASNLLSNVPFVLVLGDGYRAASEAFWYQLALTSTLAGNLTLVGSVANLIVAEASARDGVEVGFWRHLRVGVPLTLLTTAVGLAVLALLGFA